MFYVFSHRVSRDSLAEMQSERGWVGLLIKVATDALLRSLLKGL